ncbi:MAG: FecR domain-containing protein, partial [Chloroflexota bacterium]
MKTIMHRVAGVLVLLAVVVPAVSGQPDEIAATLMVLAPNVQYQRSNTDEPLFISQETIIGAGDTIRTAHSGRARIVLFGDGSRIDLESDSTLTIDRLEADEDTFDVALTLVNGETRHRVLREAGDGSVYEVETINGVITAQQGEFVVVQRDDEVAFLSVTGALTITTGEDEMTPVASGQGGRIAPDGTVSDIVPAGSLEVLVPLLDGCPGEIIPTE